METDRQKTDRQSVWSLETDERTGRQMTGRYAPDEQDRMQTGSFQIVPLCAAVLRCTYITDYKVHLKGISWIEFTLFFSSKHKKYAFKDFWLFLRSLSCIGSFRRLVGRITPKLRPNPT